MAAGVAKPFEMPYSICGPGVGVAVAATVAVTVAVGVDVAVEVAVAVAVAVGVGPVMVMRPLTWVASCVFRSPSMKKKLSGGGCQTKGLVAPGVLLTLSILNSKNVPDPDRGAKSFAKADTRAVLIGPGPGSTAPDTFQLPAVSPAFCIGGFEKLTTVSSKVKSPWKPT